jgi:hypothetical protein
VSFVQEAVDSLLEVGSKARAAINLVRQSRVERSAFRIQQQTLVGAIAVPAVFQD